MPIYEYKCSICPEYREVIHGVEEEREVKCLCGRMMQRVVSRPGLLKPHGAVHPNEPDEVERRRKEKDYRISKTVKAVERKP